MAGGCRQLRSTSSCSLACTLPSTLALLLHHTLEQEGRLFPLELEPFPSFEALQVGKGCSQLNCRSTDKAHAT